MMSHLNETSQVTPRSSVESSSVNYCRQISVCSSSLTKHPDSYQALLNVLTDDDVLLGLPCKQFGDID